MSRTEGKWASDTEVAETLQRLQKQTELDSREIVMLRQYVNGLIQAGNVLASYSNSRRAVADWLIAADMNKLSKEAFLKESIDSEKVNV